MKTYTDAQLDAALGIKKFAHFIPLGWPIIEPGTPLLRNWHQDLMAEYLQALFNREIKRLVINIPPRSGKSNFASVLFPSWVWLNNPYEKFVYISYSASLSTFHSVARRRFMQSPWYQEFYGNIFKFTSDENVKNEFANNCTGRMLATSIDGTLTGKGGNFLILDDPHNPKEAHSDVQRENALSYIRVTLPSRLDDKKNGVILCVMQRVHEKDASAMFLDEGYTHLNLQEIAESKTIITYPLSKKVKIREKDDLLHEEREGPEEIKTVKKAMGSLNFAAQYQQRPAPVEGNIYKWRYWHFYNVLPLGGIWEWLQSWDLAFKDSVTSDLVAGIVFAIRGPKKYLVNCIGTEMDVIKTIEAINAYQTIYPLITRTLIEAKANGEAVITMLQKKLSGIIGINPEGNKLSRAIASTPTVEAGDVYLPCIGDPTEWNKTPIKQRTKAMFDGLLIPQNIQEFIKILQTFPQGSTDDLVDAFSQAINYMHNMPNMSFDYINLIKQPQSKVKPRSRVEAKLAC